MSGGPEVSTLSMPVVDPRASVVQLPPRASFVLRRIGRLAVSLFALITASFLMIHLIPGDPVRSALGPTAPAELVAAKRAALGLDDPLGIQYLHYLGSVVTGQFGSSMVTGVPVVDVIAQRLPATLALALLAFAVAVLIAVPVGAGMGVLTRNGRARRAEVAFTSVSSVLGTIPDFVFGVALVFVFGVQLQLLPVAGRTGPESYILPVICLAIGPAALLARILRVEMLSVLQADFVRTARSKRLRPHLITLRHALPNALTATLTLGGLLLGGMVAGTVLVESVFAWPGLGSSIVQAILNKDYPLAQAIVLVYGATVLVLTMAVDLILAALDPRSTIGAG
jgi:peptide/nickel transport system permease protein